MDWVNKGGKIIGEEAFLYFLTILYPANQLMAFGRLLKTMNGHSKDEILKLLSKDYDIAEIKEGDIVPKNKHIHSFLIYEQWYSLKLKTGIIDESDPIKSLDVEVLKERVLEPIFGIQDPKTSKEIDYVGGIRGISELEKRCKYDAKLAFAMFPTSIDEIIKVADAGQNMPYQSVWFEPKPRSGFVINQQIRSIDKYILTGIVLGKGGQGKAEIA